MWACTRPSASSPLSGGPIGRALPGRLRTGSNGRGCPDWAPLRLARGGGGQSFEPIQKGMNSWLVCRLVKDNATGTVQVYVQVRRTLWLVTDNATGTVQVYVRTSRCGTRYGHTAIIQVVQRGQFCRFVV